MNAIQKRCRPKHQVLVLKCYPRTTKGAVDVKPNSSELSYLLFYAQSRRTKIQKIGTFLEKKTASDVYRQRIGNVQVTLQILTALIEKSPKDLPLIAPCVLKILDQVLRSNDITMVESSLPTFEAFCEHQDASSVFADQTYLRQYEGVVRRYASLASTRSTPGKGQPSKPISMRWRNAGLEAIKSVALSDPLSSVYSRQYDVLVPMILENLWTDNEEFLDVLQHRAETEDKIDPSTLLRRRTSVATVRTADTAGDTNPIALSGSAGDVDKLAEEDIGVLAMQCLKQIFVVPNRSQIHAATLALLRFVEERVSQDEAVVKTNPVSGKDGGWAIKVFGLVARWAPVQDRYTILVTALDSLTKTALVDETLHQHIVLTAMIGSLLRSDVNLIGLSVIDALLQLLSHLKRLVLMPGDPSSVRGEMPGPGHSDLRSPTTRQAAETAEKSATQRKELLYRLQQCIGDLATHVYYADQISDMILAIFVRLRPPRVNSMADTSRGDKTETTGGRSGTSASAEEHHHDSFFSLTVAKTAALKAIKAILLVANPRTKLSGNISLSRNHVPMQVWEGTQWLLRDSDGHVRKAYADALLTWLDRETTRADLRAKDDVLNIQTRPYVKSREFLGPTIGRRAASSASQREKQAKTPRSHFVELLHVAIYDNALQYVEFETDLILLHILLAKLVKQLGVNAVRYGLPMIFRLQEDIQDAETPIAKVRIGSLCHGYFWVLTDVFEFEQSVVGRAIHNEIVRRRSKHFWVEGIHVPPPLLELIGTPGVARPQPRLPLKEIETEALLPFDDRTSLVECICTSYQESTVSPPASPSTSPGRSFTQPILSSTLSFIPTIEAEHEIPTAFREQMLTDWSREATLAAIQAESKSASLNGSRTGTTVTHRNRLGANGSLFGNGRVSLSPAGSQANLRPSSSPAGGHLAPMSKLRKSSVRSNDSPLPDDGSATTNEHVTSVGQLKLVLSGQLEAPAAGLRAGADQSDDDSSDSMASYDATPSELSFNPSAAGPATNAMISDAKAASRPSTQDRKTSIGGGPLTSHPMQDIDKESDENEDHVPPVPPLPSNLDNKIHSMALQTDPADSGPRPATAKRNLKSRSRESTVSSSWTRADEVGPAMDLQSLLTGIDSRPGEQSLGHISKPPY
ncbi:hypothetical protein VTK73DRAFT_5346 [Phialemonium thermophilum]|uniref:Protein EFR3 n=1 Tax=Phialemonium thermophilum TaxID=223376 RepID=A0ABR3Y8H1_9PEZI